MKSWIVFCVSAVLMAQNQPQQAKRYPISGTVFNAVTGEPVNRALVKVQASGEQLFGFAGADGRFQIEGVPEGAANISAERPGYLNSQMGHHSGFVRPFYNVTSGTNDFSIPLQPQARVSGKVVDSDGEPIEGIPVKVSIETIEQGRKQRFQRGWGTTDENGTYRIDDLTASGADVQTMPHPVKRAEMYASSSQQVQLAAGQEAHADFKLHTVPAYTVSGVVTGAPAGGGVGIWVAGEDADQLNMGGQMFDHDTGKFVVHMLPAGSWALHFQANDGQGHTYEAELPITVSNADIKGLQVGLQPGVDIPVHLNAAPEQQTGQTGGVIMISGPLERAVSPDSPQIQATQVQVRLTSKGQQYYSQNDHIPGVLPGRYQVSAQAFNGQCVDTITSGNTDLLHNPLVVSGAEPRTITVTTRNDCGTLSVRIHSEKQNVSATILLYSDLPEAEPQLQYFQRSGDTTTVTGTTISGPAGTFSGLSPGEYRVYAFSDVDGLEYMNPEAMRNFPAQEVTIEPGGKAEVTVDLIERGGQ